MKTLLAVIFIFLAVTAHSQHIPAYSAKQLMQRVSNKDTIYIVNFWATWCVPCVKELPEFDALQELYKTKPVKIIMVSFDFKENYPKKLAAFIAKKKLTPEVVWLTDTDPNVFIPLINDSWSGSLPGTMIVHQSQSFKQFIENTITKEKVSAMVDKQMAL